MTGFDDLAPGERFPVSATLFTTYRQCPIKALARLRGMYPPTTRASFKGSLAHRIVDWKTGPNLDGAVPQLEFYAMAWYEAFCVRPCALEAVSIRTGNESKQHRQRRTLIGYAGMLR